MIRKFQKPLTPFQRLILSKEVPKKIKEQMTDLLDSLNPVDLKKQIDSKIKRIFQCQLQKNDPA